MTIESKHKHLDFIQMTITRMAANSFLIKGWNITLVSAFFALAAASSSRAFILLSFFPAITFWMLDAYYLRQEKLYRKIYEDISRKNHDSIDFSMNTSPYQNQISPGLVVMFSPALILFHGTIVTSIIITRIIIFYGIK